MSAILYDLTGYDPMLYHLLSPLVIYNPHRPCQTTDRVQFPYMYSLDTSNANDTTHQACFLFFHTETHEKNLFQFIKKGEREGGRGGSYCSA